MDNNLFNQIKMSKKFVWNSRLTAFPSIIKMSILLALLFLLENKLF